MIINPIMEKIANRIKIFKYEQAERKIAQGLQLKDLPTEVYNKIYYAREGISGFAREHGAIINISHNPQSDELIINAINKKTGSISKSQTMSADVKKIETHHPQKGYFVIEIPSDGTQIVRETQSSYDETFLRRLYRIISELCSK